MRPHLPRSARRALHQGLRQLFALLPAAPRQALTRRMVRCQPRPAAELVVKIAETREELQACFGLLHDAYVASGFMRPHPSGLRVTPWHALPTTTTICAKLGDEVVGTLSMVREGVFGLPLQSAFDLTPVRRQGGRIAEISALAIRRDHRRTGGTILFPLMKFMYEYCTRYFDTRHLVIAVHPDKFGLYESLLFFQRLAARTVEHYDFANGAPAVGAHLDLHAAVARFEQAYSGRPPHRDLHRYFVQTQLPGLHMPPRRYFTTNDPVMTPALLDHFFNQRTQTFAALAPRQLELLHSIYDSPAYHGVLPPPPADDAAWAPLRRHRRHSIQCPGWMTLATPGASQGARQRLPLNLMQISQGGCQVDLGLQALPPGSVGDLTIRLGEHTTSRVRARVVRRIGLVGALYGLAVEAPDVAWRDCVQALEGSQTYRELSGEPAAEALPEPEAAAALPA